MRPILLQVYQDIPFQKLALLLLGLFAFIALGLFVISRVKKRMEASDEVGSMQGFTLSDLRGLHKAGQISNEEFEKAKSRVIEAARRAAERDASNAAQNENGDNRPDPG